MSREELASVRQDEQRARRSTILRVAARLTAGSEAAVSVRTIALLMPAASYLLGSGCRCHLCCRAA